MVVPSREAGTPPVSYWERREYVASFAAGMDTRPTRISYTPTEDSVWETVSDALEPLWEQHAAADVIVARDRLGLPRDRVPQLVDVDAQLSMLTGFGFRAVGGLVPSVDFFAGLGRGLFSSTQYVRWEGAPTYTPEPDVVHEAIGHANCLACPELAALHRHAGAAVGRLRTKRAVQFVANVFWFSAEFGVLRQGSEAKAYGAGLLSSFAELAWFAHHAEIRPLDIAQMGTVGYHIDRFQPLLFAADSMQDVLEVIGGFLRP